MKENYKNRLILVTLLLMLVIYTLNSKFIINNVIDYSILFLTKLFPISFIYYTISSMLLDYGITNFIQKLFHTNSSKLYIFFISSISGFPSGSKYTKDMLNNNIISVETANKFLIFSHFPNPIFILTTAKLLLKEKFIKFVLISIYLSNFILMLIIKVNDGNTPVNSYSSVKDFSSILVKGIKSAFNTLLIIYGTSLFFFLISSLLLNTLNLHGILYVLICGLFDYTKGLYSISILKNEFLKGLLIIIFTMFNSLSIHLQVKSILSDTNIQYKYFLYGRILSTILSIIIFIILTILIP